MHSATCGNSSLTSMPLWPYFWNLNGDRNAAPVLRSVLQIASGSFLPCHLVSSGFGSKVSTCEAPPLAKMWMTRLALPGNAAPWARAGNRSCGIRGQRGSVAQADGQAQRAEADAAAAEKFAPREKACSSRG